MVIRYFILLSISILLYAAESFVVIANKNFPLSSLNKEQIKQIYLKRVQFINGIKIIPINYPARDSLRKEFESSILNLSQNRLKRYWMKQHYLGIRAPIIQNSVKSAIIFVKRVNGAIAYIPYSKLPKDVKVLY